MADAACSGRDRMLTVAAAGAWDRPVMLLPRLLCPLAVLCLTAAERPHQQRVLDVRPLSEEVHTDGTDDLGFSARSEPLPDDQLKRMWGVSDATARAGRLFVHTIDKDAFHGAVERYEVGGATADAPLPGWLTFDAGARAFTGVPLPAELGPHLVTVTARGRRPHSRARTASWSTWCSRATRGTPARRWTGTRTAAS
ncbi:uncharacterized protein LOC119113088 [Pollicipes pollicipes]|uniref:uncharacterized protein LOC119113088 n=1 Tax=Pollicipes pollicipes TaxID=41117 RepID=UPI001884F328|nr:uncharacterized protein LOC119113088 [Pollicipes pollicipes]